MASKVINKTFPVDVSAPENEGTVITIICRGAAGFDFSMAHPTLPVDEPGDAVLQQDLPSLPAGMKSAADAKLGTLFANAGYE